MCCKFCEKDRGGEFVQELEGMGMSEALRNIFQVVDVDN